MGATMEETVAAFMGATDGRKEAALRVLKGEGPAGSDGNPVEPFLTLREVSRRLGISACSLWRYGVPSHSFAGRARFRLSEVEAHLRAMEGRNREGRQGSRRGAAGMPGKNARPR